MFQLSLVFSHFLVKLFALRRLTQILMLGLILLLMASGVDGLSVPFLMSEFSTLVHHLIILLSLLIVAMRGRRDVSMSSVFVRLSMHGHFHRLFLLVSRSQTAIFSFILGREKNRVWYTTHRKSCAGLHCYRGG